MIGIDIEAVEIVRFVRGSQALKSRIGATPALWEGGGFALHRFEFFLSALS